MKKNDLDGDLSRLLHQWEAPTMDLSDTEHHVRRQIALSRLQPTFWTRIRESLEAWKQAFFVRPAGIPVAAFTLLIGLAGGYTLAAPTATRLSDHAKIAYAVEINPVLQSRNPK